MSQEEISADVRRIDDYFWGFAMVLVATDSVQVAQRMAELVPRSKCYVFSIPKCLSFVREHHDALVFLDAKLGGNGTRAVEWIPFLRRQLSPGEVVIMTRRPCPSEVAEAIDFGAYAVLDLEDASIERKLDRVIAAFERRGSVSFRAASAQRRVVH